VKITQSKFVLLLALLFAFPYFANAAATPTVYVYKNAAGFADSSVLTLQDFQVEGIDTDTMHSTSTNPSRITFTTAGNYVYGGAVAYSSNSSGSVQFRLNGSTILGGFAIGNINKSQGSGSGIGTFAAGDYIELLASRNGADYTSSDQSTNFWAYQIIDGSGGGSSSATTTVELPASANAANMMLTFFLAFAIFVMSALFVMYLVKRFTD